MNANLSFTIFFFLYTAACVGIGLFFGALYRHKVKPLERYSIICVGAGGGGGGSGKPKRDRKGRYAK